MKTDPDRFRRFGAATRAVFLMRTEAFKDLDPADLTALAGQSELRYFPKGSPILDPSDPPPGFHVIVRGEVETDGKEQAEPDLKTGGVVGFYSVLAGPPRTVAARARTRVLTLEIEAGAYFDLLESNFAFFQRTLATICRKILEQPGGLEPPPPRERPAEELPAVEGPLDLLQRALQLRRSLRLRSLHPDTLMEASDRLEELRFVPRTVLWDAGDPSAHMDILVEGEARTVGPGNVEKPRPAGSLLGNVEALAGVPRPTRLTTRTDVTLLRLSTEDALDILEDHFGLASDVLAGMAARWLWGLQNAPDGETNGPRSRPGGERA